MKLPTLRKTFTERSVWLISLAVVCVAMVFGGCQEEDGQTGAVEGEQGLLITPEFRVEGLDEIRGELLLEDLYLGIGEIRLEPLDEGHEGLVYVTRASFSLHFDLSEDEWTARGDQIVLPHPGEYLISITLEPVSATDSPTVRHSMRLNGLMARVNSGLDPTDKTAAGEPVPLPWRVLNEGDGEASGAPISWIPWTYSTERTSFVTLNDVHFSDESDQTLVISFDLSSWVAEVFAPINTAIEAHSLTHLEEGESSSGLDSPAIDVSETIDDRGDSFDEVTASSEAYVR